jgi:hypothetical protein
MLRIRSTPARGEEGQGHLRTTATTTHSQGRSSARCDGFFLGLDLNGRFIASAKRPSGSSFQRDPE